MILLNFMPKTWVLTNTFLDEGGIVILNPFSKQGKGVVSYPYYENFDIMRIEGTLIFE